MKPKELLLLLLTLQPLSSVIVILGYLDPPFSNLEGGFGNYS